MAFGRYLTLYICAAAFTCLGISANADTADDMAMAHNGISAEVTRPLEQRQIKVETIDGKVFTANIGYIAVPESRSISNGNTIKIAFMQIKSPAASNTPPVFHFHGGPDDRGYLSYKVPVELMNNLDSAEDVTIDFRGPSRNYREYLDYTDVIIMDDRGMGHSRPRLTCSENPHPADFLIEPKTQAENINKALSACFNEYKNKGVQLSAYNLSSIAADFNDLRSALGYQKVTLQGSSFGSQTAFTVIQQYPQHVARAYLAGLEPLGDSYDMPSEMQEATDAIIAHANANQSVREQLPNGDMAYTLRTILERLKATPQVLEIDTPQGGEISIYLDDRTASQMLLSLGMLRYRGDTSGDGGGAANIVPLILALYYEAYDGIADVLKKRIYKPSGGSVFNAAALAIDCASGISESRKEQFLAESKLPASEILLSPFGLGGLVRGQPDYYCRNNFKVHDMGDAWRTEEPSDIPVLFYHGDFDGTTPPENARRAISRFTNGKLIIVEGVAHYVKEMEQLSPELKALRTEFVLTGNIPENTPSRVTLPPIEFSTIPTPALWGFQLGLGNLLMKISQ